VSCLILATDRCSCILRPGADAFLLLLRIATLKTEQEGSLRSIQDLERDRSDLRRVTSTTRKEADDTLTLLEAERAKAESLTAQLAAIDELKSSLAAEETKRSEAEKSLGEANDEVSRLKDEVESLHEAAVARDKAAEAEKDAAAEGDKAADEERLTQLQNQHALELSTAKGQIRKLESAVFEAEKANSSSQLKGRSWARAALCHTPVLTFLLRPLQCTSCKPRWKRCARLLRSRPGTFRCRRRATRRPPPRLRDSSQPTRSITFRRDRSTPTCPPRPDTRARSRSRCLRRAWRPVPAADPAKCRPAPCRP